MVRVFDGVQEVRSALGEELGPSEWFEVTQERVDAFADATEDHQWIHVDPERAAAGPFGGTIVHGHLTLSLLPMFGASLFAVQGPGAKLNYGLDRVRFPAPLPVGSRVRARAVVVEVADVPLGARITMRYTVEAAEVAKPVCVADALVLVVDL